MGTGPARDGIKTRVGRDFETSSNWSDSIFLLLVRQFEALQSRGMTAAQASAYHLGKVLLHA